MTRIEEIVPADEPPLPFLDGADCSYDHYPDSWLERAELENVFLRDEAVAPPSWHASSNGHAANGSASNGHALNGGAVEASRDSHARDGHSPLMTTNLALRAVTAIARVYAAPWEPTSDGLPVNVDAAAPTQWSEAAGAGFAPGLEGPGHMVAGGAPPGADGAGHVGAGSAPGLESPGYVGGPRDEGSGAGEADTPTPSLQAAALVQLADASGAGFVRVDLDGTAWALNPYGALMLEAVGASDGGPAPDDLRSALAAAVLDGMPVRRDLAAPTQEARHISLAALVYGDEQLVSLRDHTEERLLQERLLQSEKMASVGQLVSGVAHELNNPLTAVTGFAQILLGRPDLDLTVRSHLRKIYEEGERAAKIVQNLLSFARRRKPSKEMTDVNVLVERVLELRSYDFGMRNISLDMTLDRRMSKVWVDPDQIQQVLFNLVKNAEQAMTDAHGGGQLTVSCATTADGAGVRITVGDSGPGIPPDVQRRIFDPFFTTKEAGQGTGLGLTISYSIVDEHGGRIWVESNPGGGAMFVIELPLDVPAQTANGSRPAAGGFLEPLQRGSTAKRILVADDEESIRLLLNDVLEMDGHSVTTASTGIEAMQTLLSGDVDLIISDMKMPGMDGATLFRELLSINPGMARRLIFMTGDTVSADTRSFLQGVSNPVIAKPFRIAALREAIEKVLGE